MSIKCVYVFEGKNIIRYPFCTKIGSSISTRNSMSILWNIDEYFESTQVFSLWLLLASVYSKKEKRWKRGGVSPMCDVWHIVDAQHTPVKSVLNDELSLCVFPWFISVVTSAEFWCDVLSTVLIFFLCKWICWLLIGISCVDIDSSFFWVRGWAGWRKDGGNYSTSAFAWSLSVSLSYLTSDAPHPCIPNLTAQNSQAQLCDIWVEILPSCGGLSCALCDI